MAATASSMENVVIYGKNVIYVSFPGLRGHRAGAVLLHSGASG
jgi:hypothetical protein